MLTSSLIKIFMLILFIAIMTVLGLNAYRLNPIELGIIILVIVSLFVCISCLIFPMNQQRQPQTPELEAPFSKA